MTDLATLLPNLCAAWATTFPQRQLPAPVVAELIVLGDQLVPALPTAPGEHRPIALDAAGGCCYVRRIGSIDLELDANTNCGTLRLLATVPVRVVALVDLHDFDCRSLEVGPVLTERLLGAIHAGGAAGARIEYKSADDDAARIFTSELGMPVALPARRGVVSLDLTLQVRIDPRCLTACPEPTINT